MGYLKGQDHDGLLEGFRMQEAEFARAYTVARAEREIVNDGASTAGRKNSARESMQAALDEIETNGTEEQKRRLLHLQDHGWPEP